LPSDPAHDVTGVGEIVSKRGGGVGRRESGIEAKLAGRRGVNDVVGVARQARLEARFTGSTKWDLWR
jgi:hypothetical protein